MFIDSATIAQNDTAWGSMFQRLSLRPPSRNLVVKGKIAGQARNDKVGFLESPDLYF